MKKFLILLFCLILQLPPSQAKDYTSNNQPINITAIPEYQTLSNSQNKLNILTKITLAKDYHLYWDNPGDVGDPTSLYFFENPHYREKNTIKSAPQKEIYDNIITSYQYTDTFYILTEFELTNLSSITHLDFKLILTGTICKKECEPITKHLNITIPIENKNKINHKYIENLSLAEPSFPHNLHIKNAILEDKTLTLNFAKDTFKSCTSPYFISIHKKEDVLSHLPQTIKKDNETLNIIFDELPLNNKGIILCNNNAFRLIDNSKTENISNQSSPKENLQHTPISPKHPLLLYYILTAFLAGLILNLMPCVLPILALKALYLAKSTEKPSKQSAISYLLGVVSSFLCLALIIYIAKNFGQTLGWGFQLQSPLFNICLALLFTLIFLNLWDVFSLDRCATGLCSKFTENNSFLTGFFAVIIACPCTGPFMGAAIGYAITADTITYFAIFISLSIGYALPYTLIEMYPNLCLKYIPQPGKYMITLKRVLSLPIALTIIWLGSLIYTQLNPKTNELSIWKPYNKTAITQDLKNHKPILINFTAKWCLTCQLNERTVFSTKAFKEIVREKNVILYKADWTNKDQNIKEALNTYQRTSVPLYVYYAPKSNSPQLLPPLLTVTMLKNILNN